MKKATRPDVRPMKEKTLDEIEGVAAGEPPVNTYLVRTICALRKKPIGQFTAEDLRITLGQKRSVRPLLPLALERLEAEPLAAGHYHRGDLLLVVLRAEPVWRGQPDGDEIAARVRTIVERALAQLATVRPIDWMAGEVPDLDALDENDRELLEPQLRAALTHL